MGTDPAIAGEEEAGPVVLGPSHCVQMDAVAFSGPMGDVRHHRAPDPGEEPRQEGRARHPVDVIVAVDIDRFLALSGAEHCPDSGLKVGQEPGIVQMVKTWIEEALGLGRVGMPTTGHDRGQERVETKFGREDRLRMGIARRHHPPLAQPRPDRHSGILLGPGDGRYSALKNSEIVSA
jgi:hypothetical protein